MNYPRTTCILFQIHGSQCVEHLCALLSRHGHAFKENAKYKRIDCVCTFGIYKCFSKTVPRMHAWAEKDANHTGIYYMVYSFPVVCSIWPHAPN